MLVSESVQLQQADGKIVTVLICPMAQRYLDDFNLAWKPILEALDGKDAFGDWARKKRLALMAERYEADAMESDNLTHGLLWLEAQWHRS